MRQWPQWNEIEKKYPGKFAVELTIPYTSAASSVSFM
jgi:hypothetical protein